MRHTIMSTATIVFLSLVFFGTSGCGPIGAPGECPEPEDLQLSRGSFEIRKHPEGTANFDDKESFAQFDGASGEELHVSLDDETVTISYVDGDGRMIRETWLIEEIETISANY